MTGITELSIGLDVSKDRNAVAVAPGDRRDPPQIRLPRLRGRGGQG